ncbi:hypothetical protein FXO37_01790 [Capsicum annuum]|nr:hypothetical protein FXO37_01790 [Capsicum annuum]
MFRSILYSEDVRDECPRHRIRKELILAKVNDLGLSKNNSEKLLREGTRSGNEQLEVVQSAGDGQKDQVSMVVASPGERVDEEQAIMVDTSTIIQALIALTVLEYSRQREHQSKNVIGTGFKLDYEQHGYSRKQQTYSRIDQYVEKGAKIAQSWVDLVDGEDGQVTSPPMHNKLSYTTPIFVPRSTKSVTSGHKNVIANKNESNLVGSKFSPTTVDLSKDVLDKEADDIDLGEDSFGEDEEDNILDIYFVIVARAGDVSPRHQRSGRNKNKKNTH